jgi:hypothetical protein
MEHMQFAYWITKAKQIIIIIIKQTNKQTNKHTPNIQKLLLFHGNNGYTNAPQCYIMCTVSVMLDKRYVITNCDWFRTCPNESFQQVSAPYCALHLALFHYSQIFLSLFFMLCRNVSFWALVFMFTPTLCFKWWPRAVVWVQPGDEMTMLLKAEHFSWS